MLVIALEKRTEPITYERNILYLRLIIYFLFF